MLESQESQADPFTLLGLPRSPLVSARDVQRAYLARVAQVHPDLTGDAAEQQSRIAALHSAKTTLEDPLLRAQALAGWETLPEADRAALPPQFLMDIMQLREDAEAALAAAAQEVIAAHARAADDRLAAIEREFANAWQHRPHETRTLVMTINAWRYLQRLRARLDGER